MAKGTVNKVIVLGRLGQDPDMRSTAAGTQVANLNVATTEMSAADQSGNRQEQTEWHRVVLFGKAAELAGQYLKKGSQVYIEGRLQTRKWQDQSGNDRYSTEIVGREMQFIGGNPNSNQGGQQQAQQQRPPQQQGQGFGQPSGQPAPQPDQGYDQFNDDPPF